MRGRADRRREIGAGLGVAEILRSDPKVLRLVSLTALIFVAMSVLSPGKFLSGANLESMAFQFPELGLLSLAMMLAMITGGIDLSVVATANLSGIVAALVLRRALPAGEAGGTPFPAIALAVLAALGCSVACGAFNSLLITRIRISPILATLGTLQLYTGIALVITGGHAVFGFPEAYLALGNGTFLGLPLPFLLFAAVALAVAVLSSRTAFGIEQRLLGTNPLAAFFAGIRLRSVLARTYLATGIIAGLTGLLMIARTNSAKADYGSSYLLQAILVAVLGGVHPAGGFGSVVGVSVALLALQFLASGFNLLQFSNFARELVWGAFLLAIMVINYLGERRRERRSPQAERGSRPGPAA